jgi:hypothetical protein
MRILVPRLGRGESGPGRPRPGPLFLAVLLVLGAATCRRPPADPDAPAEALRLIDRALASSEAEKDLFDLCDRFEDRVSGSRGSEAAGWWLVRRLREAGLDTVQAESFPLAEPWIPGREEAECTDPVAFPVRVAAVPGSPETPSPELPLRVAPLAGPDADPGSAVALFATPRLPSAGQVDVKALREAVSQAARAGYRALLIQSALPGRTLFRVRVAPLGGLPLPVAIAAREDFERLARLNAASPVRIRLRLEPSHEKPADGLNVVGEIRGREVPEEIVLLGAHYDAWDLGAGAQDNAVNVALVLDVARGFRELGLTPRRTVRFVLFSGEEQDRQGSAAYVDAHEAELDRHALALFFDLGGGKINGFYFNGRRELAGLFIEAMRPFPAFRSFRPLNLVYSGTDNLDFLLAGVPNVVAATDLEPYAPVYHSELDLPGAIDPQALRRNVAFASAIAWQLADRAGRPAERLGPDATRALVERLGIGREIEGTWRQDRLRARR